ncbi:hypothetical protein O5699_22940 [Escherichia coli]|nr:hypothetical protein [Escherichia coli]
MKADTLRIAGALWLTEQSFTDEASAPVLNGLYQALENRLMKAGGVDAVVPQEAAAPAPAVTSGSVTALSAITSDRNCCHRLVFWQNICVTSLRAGWRLIG